MKLWSDGTGFDVLSHYGRWQFIERWNKDHTLDEMGAFFERNRGWVGRMAHLGRQAGWNIPKRQHGVKTARPKPKFNIRVIHRNGVVSTVGSGDRHLAEAWAEAWRQEVA